MSVTDRRKNWHAYHAVPRTVHYGVLRETVKAGPPWGEQVTLPAGLAVCIEDADNQLPDGEIQYWLVQVGADYKRHGVNLDRLGRLLDGNGVGLAEADVSIFRRGVEEQYYPGVHRGWEYSLPERPGDVRTFGDLGERLTQVEVETHLLKLHGLPRHSIRNLRPIQPVLELSLNGDPFGSGFTACESYDDETWFYRGDIGAKPRRWWRDYARRYGYRLREATGQYSLRSEKNRATVPA